MSSLVVLAIFLITFSLLLLFLCNFVLCNLVVLLSALFEHSYNRGDIYGIIVSCIISFFHGGIQMLLWFPILKILFVLKSSSLAISFIIGTCNFLLSFTFGILSARLGTISEQNESLRFLNVPLSIVLWIASHKRIRSRKSTNSDQKQGLLEQIEDEDELSSSWWVPKTVVKPSLTTYFDGKLQNYRRIQTGSSEVN